ncbi:MAG: LapA family protein [Legionellaceae bacterium]|nr:LapA family protein [Legionellaceae bacterium]
MRIFIIIFYLILILLGISFAALNATQVQVNFYFTTLNMPVSVLVIIMLGVGVVIGAILFLSRYWRLKSVNRKIKNQLKWTEREIKNLRTLPIRNEDSTF